MLNFLSLIVVIFAFPIVMYGHTSTSKTFFMPRATGSDLALLNAGTHHFIREHEPADRFFFNVTGFYQESTNSRELAKYFFPTGKSVLQIKGALAEGPAPDISGTWLQIAGKNTNPTGNTFPDGTSFDGVTTRADVELFLNEFESKIKISPEYRSFGSIFQFYTNLGFIDDRLWFSVDVPVVQVETNARLQEFDIKNAGESKNSINDFKINAGSIVLADISRLEAPKFSNMLNATEAFNNPSWRYGKIKNGTQVLVGVADITTKLGFHVVQQSSVRISGYGKLVIPTSYKPKVEFLCEPILGNGQHIGIGGGLSTDISLISKCDTHFFFSSNFDYLHLLGNTEPRSFDLNKNNQGGGGEWSRYFLVADLKQVSSELSQVLQPGINFFTRQVKVEPRHEINWINSFNLIWDKFVFEFGYNLWFKAKEHINFKNNFPQENIAIANTHFGSTSAQLPFEVNSFSQATIDQHISNANTDPKTDPVFIKQDDLNKDSGIHHDHLSHKFYILIGINSHWNNYPFQAQVGGAYELAQNNASLDFWQILLKINLLT